MSFIYKKYKTDEEDYLAFKLVGFYLLCTFRFNFNNLPLPAGFIVFLLLFKPKTNNRAKRAAAFLGLFVFIYGLLMPQFQKAYFERQREIGISSTNIYSVDLKGDFQTIREKFEAEGIAKIEDFHVSFEKSGAIKELRYRFLTRDGKGNILHTVLFIAGKNKYTIWKRRVNQWVQYDRLINEEQFFYALEHLDIKQAIPQRDFPYYTIKCRGDYSSWAVKDWDNYFITESGPQKVENEGLPIEGYVFWIFGNRQTGEGSYESDEHKAYVLPGNR